jgi:hypothetical protein
MYVIDAYTTKIMKIAVRIIFINPLASEVNVDANPISIPIRADAIITKSIAVCVKTATRTVMRVNIIEIFKALIICLLILFSSIPHSISFPIRNVAIVMKYTTNTVKNASIILFYLPKNGGTKASNKLGVILFILTPPKMKKEFIFRKSKK